LESFVSLHVMRSY